MSNKDPMKALQAYLALKKRADAGDPKAQAEIKKIAANPKALLQLKQIAASAQAMVKAATAATILGAINEPTPEDVYEGDDVDLADRVHRQLPPGSGDLEHKALLRKAKWSNLDQVAPFARTNPPSVLQGTLGGYQIVDAGGPAIQVCNWSGDDSETCPVGITLAPVEQLVGASPEGLAQTAARPFAIIQFGTRGMSVKAEVDIGTGCQLVVGGSSVLVQVAMDPAPTGLKAGEMKLAGMLSFHPTIRTTPVTRTRYVDANGQTTQDLIPIPPFSQRVSWYSHNTAGVVTQLTVEDLAGNALYWVTTTLPGAITNVELSSDAVFVRVDVSGAGALNVQGRLIFDLSF